MSEKSLTGSHTISGANPCHLVLERERQREEKNKFPQQAASQPSEYEQTRR